MESGGIIGINKGAMKPSMGKWKYQCINGIINGPMELLMDQWNHQWINGSMESIIELYWIGLKKHQKSRAIGALSMGQLR